MSKHRNAAIDRDRLPFVAPCRKLSPWAPFRWVRLGFSDLARAPRQSLVYGLAVAVTRGRHLRVQPDRRDWRAIRIGLPVVIVLNWAWLLWNGET